MSPKEPVAPGRNLAIVSVRQSRDAPPGWMVVDRPVDAAAMSPFEICYLFPLYRYSGDPRTGQMELGL